MRYKILSTETKNNENAFIHVFSDKVKAESMLKKLNEVSDIQAGFAEKIGNLKLASELRASAKGLHIVEF